MPLQSGSLQTPVTDFAVAGILDGQVTAMDVLDPTDGVSLARVITCRAARCR